MLFDYDNICDDKINVKTLKSGTKFTTLDGIERKLTKWWFNDFAAEINHYA